MNARQLAIIEQLHGKTRVNVKDLASCFGVSEMTIRRDLIALETHGTLVRTYGGGAALTGATTLATPPAPTRNARKAAIGQLAAGLVQPGQTIMVDTGTTALEVALHLPHDSRITVATTSLRVAEAMSHTPLQVLLLGGFLRKESQTLYGPLTEHMLSILHVDFLFIGCTGANSEDGFYVTDLLLFSQLQAMMRIADRLVVVTESRKFGRRSFVRYAQLGEVHTLVTDDGLSAPDRANLEEHGVRILCASEAAVLGEGTTSTPFA